MFEFQFSNSKVNCAKLVVGNRSGLLMPLVWGEHCMECSAPECYATCTRYQARADGHCRRFSNGVEPFAKGNKLMAKVSFKDWGKLEADLCAFLVEGNVYDRLYEKSVKWGAICAFMSKIMPGFNLKSKWFGVWRKINSATLDKCQHCALTSMCLVGTIYNDDKPTSIFVDLKTKNQEVIFRQKVEVPLGKTELSINLERVDEAKVINIHPANVEEMVCLTFESLEVVPAEDETPAKKVKCVIWDLDGTLWNGVLIENGDAKPKHEFVEIIKQLDKKGIVNSIASKNDEEQVLPILKETGIDEYFVFKKINWEPKSHNILRTIKSMNINANSVVFVDDNPFEREEVREAIPSVTCVDPRDVFDLISSDRFDVPVSEESSKRRESYKMLEALKKEEEAWSGSIDDFLLSCQIKLEISKPDESNLSRCYELLQRTNQLNSSGRRLSFEEVSAIVCSPQYDSYVLESSDKFGSYGIVGFLIVNVSLEARVTDFVISCRVANKKIEPTIINYLAAKYKGSILFDFKKTKLNGPMKSVINELSMSLVSVESDKELYRHSCIQYPNIVEIKDCSNDA